MVPEEQWRVVGESPTFQTKAQGVAYMHSLTSKDFRYLWLTIERALTFVPDSAEQYRYEAPKIAPTTGAWSYQRVPVLRKNSIMASEMGGGRNCGMIMAC